MKFILTILLLCSVEASAYTFIQECHDTSKDLNSAVSSDSCTFASPVGAHHLIVFFVDADDGGLGSTVSDPLGETLALNCSANAWNGGGKSSQGYWANTNALTGTSTPTVTFNPTGTFIAVFAAEYDPGGDVTPDSGAGSPCSGNVGIANNTTVTGSNMVSSFASDPIIGYAVTIDDSLAVGSGFTQRLNLTTTTGGFATEHHLIQDKAAGAAGTYTVSSVLGNNLDGGCGAGTGNCWGMIGAIFTFTPVVSNVPRKKGFVN